MTVIATTPDRGLGARAVASLATVEARRILRHPVMLAGVAILVLFSVQMLRATAAEVHFAVAGGMIFTPLAAATLVAANLAVLRARRTAEADAALQITPVQRTAAHLLSVVAPALVAAVVSVVYAVVAVSTGATTAGSLRAVPSALELLHAPALVLLAGTLGVAFARWLPHPVAAVLGALVLFWSPLTWYVPWTMLEPHPILDGFGTVVGSVAWHHVFVLGLAVAAGAASLLRHVRRPAVGLVALGAFAVAVGAFTAIDWRWV